MADYDEDLSFPDESETAVAPRGRFSKALIGRPDNSWRQQLKKQEVQLNEFGRQTARAQAETAAARLAFDLTKEQVEQRQQARALNQATELYKGLVDLDLEKPESIYEARKLAAKLPMAFRDQSASKFFSEWTADHDARWKDQREIEKEQRVATQKEKDESSTAEQKAWMAQANRERAGQIAKEGGLEMSGVEIAGGQKPCSPPRRPRTAPLVKS